MSAPLVVPLSAGAPPASDEGAQPPPQYAPVTGAPFPVNGGGPAPAAQTAPRPAQQTSTSTATPLTAEDYSALIDRKVQRTLDMLAPYQLYRWLGLGMLSGDPPLEQRVVRLTVRLFGWKGILLTFSFACALVWVV